MTDQLKWNLEYSVNLMRKAENIALNYSDDGYHLAFSGGKDSQILHHTAKLAGVKFKAHMQMTSVDPPELLRFIRRNYPDVVMHAPEKSIFKLIREKGMLPTRRLRYCCQVLKKQAGRGAVTLLGLRASESPKRAKRSEFAAGYKPLDIDQFNNNKEQMISCVGGRDKIMLSPILKWSEENVWEFILENDLPYCELYDEGFTRIGCLFCPMARPKTKLLEREMYPGVEREYKRAIQYVIDTKNYYEKLDHNADEVFNWWISNKSVDDYIKSRLKTPENI